MLKGNIFKCIMTAVLVACICNLNYLFRNISYDTTVDMLFLTSVFDSTTILEKKSLMLGMENLFAAMLFLFLIHDFISRDILNQGTYALVRVPDRRRWCFGKLMQLAVLCLTYAGAYITTVFWLCVKSGQGKFGGREGYVFLYMYFSLVVLLLPCALVTVLLDMQSGREIAVLVGIGMLAVLILFGIGGYERQVSLWLQAFNPAAGILLYHHGGRKLKAAFFLGFLADNSILAWWICRYVQKFDAVRNREHRI